MLKKLLCVGCGRLFSLSGIYWQGKSLVSRVFGGGRWYDQNTYHILWHTVKEEKSERPDGRRKSKTAQYWFQK